METITINIFKDDVYEEVAKATDYTGSKLIDGDEKARDRILAADADLDTLGRFWDETVMACNENFKEMLVSGQTKSVSYNTAEQGVPVVQPRATMGDIALSLLPTKPAYVAVIEVSKSFDKTLTESVQATIRSYFIAAIIGQWFKFANKGEAGDYFTQAADMLDGAERMLYSRRKPTRPTD